ncbi:MAG: GNAT family N-acetyltransferase [Bacteroidetes bacterium]|nr:GNAT family N-acetyltransferase [Bacteroidota bacterium]
MDALGLELTNDIPVINTEMHSGLFTRFPNYSGEVAFGGRAYPMSWLELSRPTGKYIARFPLYVLNAFIRRHSICVAGNACAPGFVLPLPDATQGMEQFQFDEREHCGTLILNVPGIPILKDAIVFQAHPFMKLNIHSQWENLEQYLGAMHSKYRVRARKALQCSGHLQTQSFSGQQLDALLLSRCAWLLAETLRNKTLALSPDLAGMLSAFRDTYKERFAIHTYTENGELRGFISTLEDGKQLHALHLGYDAAIARDTHIYQRMMYDRVGQAIESRAEVLHLGRTATEIKSTLGAVPVPNSFAVYVRNPMLRAMVAWWKKRWYKPAEYTLREPFK